jgi:hypothetical protein
MTDVKTETVQAAARILTGWPLPIVLGIDETGFVVSDGTENIALAVLHDGRFEARQDGEDEPFRTGSWTELHETRRGLLTLRLNLTDAEAFTAAMGRESLAQVDGAAIEERFLVPRSAALGNAVRIDTVDVFTEADTGRMEILTAFDITDEGALTRAAREAYADCWGDRDWMPGSLEETLYELYAASNANPSPDEMGFEFASWESARTTPQEDTPGASL